METGVDKVVNRIVWAMENKPSTLGMFWGIEGVFDKTIYKSVELALQEHNNE